MVRGVGGVVGRVRQLEGRSGMESVELGGGEDDRDDGDSALVSCNSGEGQTSSGTIL